MILISQNKSCNINLSELAQFKTHTKTTPKLKIAGVFDEFSFAAFSYEADIINVTPDNYKLVIQEFAPDIFFIESAWFGHNNLWKRQISDNGRKAQQLIKYCKEIGLLTVFWNKEDPVSFKRFLPIARQVDCVFTTEEACISRYKSVLGHANVYLLQFAVQPKLHNPIEKDDRLDKFCFAGSYYYQYKQRRIDFERMLKIIKRYRKIEIYDRYYKNKSLSSRAFPRKYNYLIKGKLSFAEIDTAYKGYLYALNFNTVKDSDTMLSRRVFELLASNTIIISNYSKAVRRLFGKIVCSSDNEPEINHYLEYILNNPLALHKTRLLGLRHVMQYHTYFDRMRVIKSVVSGNQYLDSSPNVLVIAYITNNNEENSIIQSYIRQAYQHKQLLLVTTNYQVQLSGSKDIISCSVNDGVEYILQCKMTYQFVGFLSPDDYYGSNYLLDLVLADKYSKAIAFGKACYYQYTDNQCVMINEYQQYKNTSNLSLRSSIIRLESIDKMVLSTWVNNIANIVINMPAMLSIDEFNYCKDGARNVHLVSKVVDDINPDDIYRNYCPKKLGHGISVIIPSYNSVGFLTTCIVSLANQVLDNKYFEVIVVLNGLDDGSKSLLLELKDRYCNLNIIIVEAIIEGVSNARNIGVTRAQYEYIVFIDTDDTVSPNYLNALLKYAAPDTITFAELKQLNSYLSMPYLISIAQSNVFMYNIVVIVGTFTMNACKIVPTKYMREFSFDTQLKSSEDLVFFTALYFSRNLKIKVVPKSEQAIYYRLIRQDSVSQSTCLSFDFHILQRIRVIKSLLNSIDNYKQIINPIKLTLITYKIIVELIYPIRTVVNYIFTKK